MVDVRRRMAFAASQLKGSVSFEYGRGTSFTAYLGWVLPWNRQLTLVGAEDDVEKAIRDLSRIGIDSPDAALGTEPSELAPGTDVAHYPRVDWGGLHERSPGDVVLDVRRVDEYDAGHLAGAVNIPLHELLQRMPEIPDGKVWVHCASGYRSGVAASLLQRAGREVVHVDARYPPA